MQKIQMYSAVLCLFQVQKRVTFAFCNISELICLVRAGELCKGCECVECLNDGLHEIVSVKSIALHIMDSRWFISTVSQERQAAVEHIKTSDPLAFHDKVRSAGGADTASSQEEISSQASPPEAVVAAPPIGFGPQQLHIRGPFFPSFTQ
jgi:hypothetical protein